MLEQLIDFFTLTQQESSALRLSLEVSVTAMLWNLPFAIFAAWLLARKNFYGKSIVDGLLHLPLVLPPVVIGYLLLVVMGRNGVIGQYLFSWFGISFAFSWRGAVLAAMVMSFPLVVRTIRLSLESIDPKLEQAARTLGASVWRVFFTITLPLALPGVLAGVILGFARSLGEFGATITFVSNIEGQTQTIPLAMYSFIQTPGAEEQTFKLCVLSIILSLSSLVLSEYLAKRMKARLGQ
ncbi:molybdate ABC transporter permease [Mergibacter septicus]|uniref:Molybdenum transport system permease n=1 Tax=Mergibacter septicus TaxID=221402 RepID=A0A8D4IZQ4_9PAST|nr:molybdate ABC transporter permease subunit [Mergibacter septicus]AWX15569.1 molybdate ABC transporter permease [Mergibacter septicus]QDJ14823.1 molybdate ABC transporter permease [Mergibacter septicus]UTU47749.1 molybdate ABC transporter permease subunit [Mergibacter septicus]WMR96645.1 molybdate ABC transporter permease subunit [Mergibacter septicus]